MEALVVEKATRVLEASPKLPIFTLLVLSTKLGQIRTTCCRDQRRNHHEAALEMQQSWYPSGCMI